MRVRVDPKICAASANCVAICPEVFKLEGEFSEVKVDIVPPQHEAVCRTAKDACPTGAISLQE